MIGCEYFMQSTKFQQLRTIFTDILLMIISVLYLFELNYNQLSVWNWIGVAIVALAIIPTLVRFIVHIVKNVGKFQNWRKQRSEKRNQK